MDAIIWETKRILLVFSLVLTNPVLSLPFVWSYELLGSPFGVQDTLEWFLATTTQIPASLCFDKLGVPASYLLFPLPKFSVSHCGFSLLKCFWKYFFFNHKSEITTSLVGQNGNCPCLLISAVTERHVVQDSWDLRVKHYISVQLCPNDSLSGLVFLFCKMRIYYLLLVHIYQGRFLNVPCSWAASTTTRGC